MKDKEARKFQILNSLIFHYISTAKPVGSETIVEKYLTGLSSATVRNYFAELEEEGYLTHPHTSAGRVPTDKGYRLYVDRVMEIQRLAAEDEMRIQHEYQVKMQEMDKLWLTTTKMLSIMSHYAGFILVPQLKKMSIRSYHLINYDKQRVLIVVVTNTGMVWHQVVDFKCQVKWKKVKYIENFMNAELANNSVQEIRKKWETLRTEYEKSDSQMWSVIEQLLSELDKIPLEETYVDGEGNILSLSEYHDMQNSIEVMSLVKDKKLLNEVMHNYLIKQLTQGKKVNIAIGSENMRSELNEWSLVTTSYTMQERMIGLLGILGPKRMDYGRMVAIVDSISNAVNNALKGQYGVRVYEKRSRK
ncbi:MAG: heat-inducible transcriptional repressor HrcA [Elusimicrobiota bacterium]